MEVLKNSNGNLIESYKIIRNIVALKDKEEGIKGLNLGLKQAHKGKKNDTCFMLINTIPATSTECFPTNSSSGNGVLDMVRLREVA
jgi:hypothetical protein